MTTQAGLLQLDGGHLALSSAGSHPMFRALCHDLRQPLAAIMVTASAIGDDPTLDGRILDGLDRIQNQVSVMLDVIGSVLAEPSVPSRVPLGDVVEDVVRTTRTTYGGCLTFTCVDAASSVVACHPAFVRRAVGNLIENAVRAAGTGGVVNVLLLRDGDFVEVSVEDCGPGFGAIPSGGGIGLPVVRSLAAHVGGCLTLGRSDLGGVRAVLRLPVDVSEAATDGNP